MSSSFMYESDVSTTRSSCAASSRALPQISLESPFAQTLRDELVRQLFDSTLFAKTVSSLVAPIISQAVNLAKVQIGSELNKLLNRVSALETLVAHESSSSPSPAIMHVSTNADSLSINQTTPKACLTKLLEDCNRSTHHSQTPDLYEDNLMCVTPKPSTLLDERVDRNCEESIKQSGFEGDCVNTPKAQITIPKLSLPFEEYALDKKFQKQESKRATKTSELRKSLSDLHSLSKLKSCKEIEKGQKYTASQLSERARLLLNRKPSVQTPTSLRIIDRSPNRPATDRSHSKKSSEKIESGNISGEQSKFPMNKSRFDISKKLKLEANAAAQAAAHAIAQQQTAVVEDSNQADENVIDSPPQKPISLRLADSMVMQSQQLRDSKVFGRSIHI